MDIILLLARLLLAVVFVAAGLAKLADRAGSRRALLDFGVPSGLAAPLVVLLPLAELAAAAALIPTISAWWGALGALALLLLFVAAIGYNLAHGRTPDCHCFGQLRSTPAGWPTLARNLILSVIAGFIVVFGRTNVGASAIDWLGTLTTVQRIEVAVATLVVALFIVETWVVLQVLRQHGDVLLRLDELETRLAEYGTKVLPELPSSSANGLAIGTVAPAFRLSGLYGETITLDYLRANNKPVMLIFSDPGCGPCTTLLPEIGRWQRDYASKLTLALISRGSPEANRDKSSIYELTHVLLQQDREVAEVYQARGTPCAVLIHPDGTINSLLACGADLIRALCAQAVGLPALKPPQAATTNKNGAALPMVAVSDGNGAVPGQTSRSQIGAPAPAFTLPDLYGQAISLSDFRGSTTLLLFWNPDCGFCQQMLADLKSWEAEPPRDAPNLLLVSTGGVDKNQAQGFQSSVLLDGGFTIGPKFGIHGTPMAVLVDAEGKIASGVAAGAPEVLALAQTGILSPKPG